MTAGSEAPVNPPEQRGRGSQGGRKEGGWTGEMAQCVHACAGFGRFCGPHLFDVNENESKEIKEKKKEEGAVMAAASSMCLLAYFAVT